MHNGHGREGGGSGSESAHLATLVAAGLHENQSGSQAAPTTAFDSFAHAIEGLYGSPIRAMDGTPFRSLVERPSSKGPDIVHNGIAFSVRDVEGLGRVVVFAPQHLAEIRGILIQCSGYMQGVTSMLTDKILEPLKSIMEAKGLVGVAYVHGGRGGANPRIDQGRWGIGRLQKEVAQHMKILLPLLQANVADENSQQDGGQPPAVALMGHSQGAQTVGHMLRDPAAYGFEPGQIRGAALINSVAIPYSQAMLRTPRLVTDIVRRNIKDVGGSLWSGEGLLFRGEQAFDTFLAEGDPRGTSERRLIAGTYPAEAMYFVQTLTSGTSPSLDPARVAGMPISLITSRDDQLMGEYAQRMTRDHLRRSGADVFWKIVPGRHFSPIVTFADEPIERVIEIMQSNAIAFDHAFQGL